MTNDVKTTVESIVQTELEDYGFTNPLAYNIHGDLVPREQAFLDATTKIYVLSHKTGGRLEVTYPDIVTDPCSVQALRQGVHSYQEVQHLRIGTKLVYTGGTQSIEWNIVDGDIEWELIDVPDFSDPRLDQMMKERHDLV